MPDEYPGGADCRLGIGAPPPGNEFSRVAVGYHHACASGADGDVVCWGNEGFGGLPHGEGGGICGTGILPRNGNLDNEEPTGLACPVVPASIGVAPYRLPTAAARPPESGANLVATDFSTCVRSDRGVDCYTHDFRQSEADGRACRAYAPTIDEPSTLFAGPTVVCSCGTRVCTCWSPLEERACESSPSPPAGPAE